MRHSTWFVRSGLLGVLVAVALVASISAQSVDPPRPAVPVEPIAAILDAFNSHSIVALCDAHGNEQAHAFLLSLLRHPRFAATVNDIVVEFGNAKYQDVVDRFVRGEDVPDETLRLIWRNTTMPHGAADLPMFEEVFRAVRDINKSPPPERRLRVLLGDPPIDWDTVRGKEDHFTWIAMRDSYPAALIQVEVLAKRRRALVLYGQLHFQRQNLFSNYDMTMWQAQTIVSLLERASPTTVFTIWRISLADLQPDAASWRIPSLARVRGTVLGAADFSSYYSGQMTRATFKDGARVAVPKEDWRSLRAEEQLDAILYVGPPSAMTNSRLPPALCTEPGYVEMRLARIALAGGPKVEADRLKEYCASVAPK